MRLRHNGRDNIHGKGIGDVVEVLHKNSVVSLAHLGGPVGRKARKVGEGKGREGPAADTLVRTSPIFPPAGERQSSQCPLQLLLFPQ